MTRKAGWTLHLTPPPLSRTIHRLAYFAWTPVWNDGLRIKKTFIKVSHLLAEMSWSRHFRKQNSQRHMWPTPRAWPAAPCSWLILGLKHPFSSKFSRELDVLWRFPARTEQNLSIIEIRNVHHRLVNIAEWIVSVDSRYAIRTLNHKCEIRSRSYGILVLLD